MNWKVNAVKDLFSLDVFDSYSDVESDCFERKPELHQDVLTGHIPN